MGEGKKAEAKEVKTEYDDLGFVKDHVCPKCAGQLKFSHEDDVGTNFFECEKCGEISHKPKSKPKTTERLQFEEALKTAAKPGTLKFVPSPSKKPSQADTLILLCQAREPDLFHDQHKTPYARIEENNAKITLPIRSKPFKSWLANLLWKAVGKAPGTEALYQAINILEAIALFEGSMHTLYNRVAPAEDGFWIDMSDDKWRAIKVTAQGWQIVDNPPILFKRHSHQKPLVEPKSNGDPKAFLDFINIKKGDENTKLLLLCTVISYLIPMIPHIIIIGYGIQGSGKTFFFKIARSVIDPSAVEVLTLPRDERERVQQLDHHWCAFYDNVTRLPSWMSDTLCRAATGGGFTKRELYTNDSDIIYNFKRCVGLNGINIAAQRGDLLDRSLLVGFENIPKEKRKTEAYLLKELEKCKPEILGGFLDTLVKAIEIYPSVDPKELFRMADFTRWGIAIAMALGYRKEDFRNAYEAKVKMQIEEAAHASPLATVLLDFMTLHQNWEGTPTQLFKALANHAKDNVGISTRQKAWPKAPHILVRQLNELIPALKELALEVTTRRTGAARRIEINSVTSVTSVTPEQKNGISRFFPEEKPISKLSKNDGKNDDSDDSDGTFTSSSKHLNEIKAVYWDDALFDEHECCICHSRKKTSWVAEDFKENKQPICEDCKDEWEKQRET